MAFGATLCSPRRRNRSDSCGPPWPSALSSVVKMRSCVRPWLVAGVIRNPLGAWVRETRRRRCGGRFSYFTTEEERRAPVGHRSSLCAESGGTDATRVRAGERHAPGRVARFARTHIRFLRAPRHEQRDAGLLRGLFSTSGHRQSIVVRTGFLPIMSSLARCRTGINCIPREKMAAETVI